MSAPVLRLFWKECRAQLSVWTALLAGVLLLELAALALFPPARRDLGYCELLVRVARILSACFAVASTAILFAGEREEKTDAWLQQLPASSRQLVLGKIGFAATATVAFLIASLALTAGVVLAHDVPRNADWLLWFDVREWLLVIAGCFAWGLFWSLRLSRVLWSLVITALAETATCWLALVISHAAAPSPASVPDSLRSKLTSGIHLAVILAVFAVDLWLVARWHRGAAGRMALPLGLWPAGASARLKALQWCANRATVERRTWSVLSWKEARTALPLTGGMVVAGALLIEFVGSWMPVSFNLFVLSFSVVFCGVMTFCGEHEEHGTEFLAHRGVSATRIWLTKTLVWMTAGLLTVSILLLWDRWVYLRHLRPDLPATASSVKDLTAYGVLQQVTRVPRPAGAPPFVIDVPDRWWGFVAAAYLSLFAAGQLASFWIRRTVLSVFVGVLFGVCLIGWCTVLSFADVTLWASGLLAGLLLLATWATRRSWLDDRSGWRLRAVQSLWIVVPFLLSATIALAARAWQIPPADPGFYWEVHEFETLQSYDPRWSAHFASSTDEWPAVASEIRPGRRLDPLLFFPVFQQGPTFEWTNGLLTRLDEQAPTAPLDERLRELQLALRYARYVATQCTSWEEWWRCLYVEQAILARVRAWAADDGQTVELLSMALHRLREELPAPPSPLEMLKTRYVVFRQLYEGRGRMGEWLKRQLQREAELPPGLTLIASSAERERLIRLLGWITRVDCENLPTDRDRPPQAAVRRELARYAASTPWLPPEFRSDPALDPLGDEPAFWTNLTFLNTLAAERGTLITIALQCHLLELGEFPPRLSDLHTVPLPDDDIWPLIVDPWTGAEFGYSPTGLNEYLSQEVTDETARLSGQPVLWSQGPGRQPISPLGISIPGQSGTSGTQPVKVPRRILFLIGGQPAIETNWRWPQWEDGPADRTQLE